MKKPQREFLEGLAEMRPEAQLAYLRALLDRPDVELKPLKRAWIVELIDEMGAE